MPNSIGISPLRSSHPRESHDSWVRASTRFYPRFTLLKLSSSGFGSCPCDDRPYQARFHYVSGVFTPLDMPHRTNSLDRATKSTPSPAHHATHDTRNKNAKCKNKNYGIRHRRIRHLFTLNFTFFIHITRSVMRRLRLFVSMWFQVYFTSLSGYFSPFPHGTSSLSILNDI